MESVTQPATLLTLPPDATPAERRALLEKIAREQNLPTVTTWEAWDASFGPLKPISEEEIARFEAAIARDKR